MYRIQTSDGTTIDKTFATPEDAAVHLGLPHLSCGYTVLVRQGDHETECEAWSAYATEAEVDGDGAHAPRIISVSLSA